MFVLVEVWEYVCSKSLNENRVGIERSANLCLLLPLVLFVHTHKTAGTLRSSPGTFTLSDASVTSQVLLMFVSVKLSPRKSWAYCQSAECVCVCVCVFVCVFECVSVLRITGVVCVCVSVFECVHLLIL